MRCRYQMSNVLMNSIFPYKIHFSPPVSSLSDQCLLGTDRPRGDQWLLHPGLAQSALNCHRQVWFNTSWAQRDVKEHWSEAEMCCRGLLTAQLACEQEWAIPGCAQWILNTARGTFFLGPFEMKFDASGGITLQQPAVLREGALQGEVIGEIQSREC